MPKLRGDLRGKSPAMQWQSKSGIRGDYTVVQSAIVP
jgi:hypothetical protein